MDQALAWLTNPWDMLVASGLLRVGVGSLVEARCRVRLAGPVEGMAREARSKLPF